MGERFWATSSRAYYLYDIEGPAQDMADPSALLAALLVAPDERNARDTARRHLADALPSPRTQPAQLGEQLRNLLETQRKEAERLGSELDAAKDRTAHLVQDTRTRTAKIRQRAQALRDGHEAVETGLASVTDKLVSGLETTDLETDGLTLRERLVALADRRQQLVAAQKWFGAVAKAETLGSV